jgi:XTP/dITP diphosphohydrolase
MILVIATHNRKKAGEMLQILSARFPAVEFQTLADYEGAPDPEESGTTYAENASIKAASAARFTGEWCIADDAGLEIDALGGEPGLYSKRFAGEDTPFPEKMRIILDRMAGMCAEQRAARFRCCVAVAQQVSGETPALQVFEATCEGRIAEEPSGNGGFGYDPIFFLPELGCTMADLTAEQKHAISHRGKVLSAVAEWLDDNLAKMSA